MVQLRSGLQTRYGQYHVDYCSLFLRGNYPDLTSLSIVQLRQLLNSLRENYFTNGTVQHELSDTREDIMNSLRENYFTSWSPYGSHSNEDSFQENQSIFRVSFSHVVNIFIQMY